jgi:hypothetical protein
MRPGHCPYCGTAHDRFEPLKACVESCYETRVAPLPLGLRVAVLQSTMTLEAAELAAGGRAIDGSPVGER